MQFPKPSWRGSSRLHLRTEGAGGGAALGARATPVPRTARLARPGPARVGTEVGIQFQGPQESWGRNASSSDLLFFGSHLPFSGSKHGAGKGGPQPTAHLSCLPPPTPAPAIPPPQRFFKLNPAPKVAGKIKQVVTDIKNNNDDNNNKSHFFFKGRKRLI